MRRLTRCSVIPAMGPTLVLIIVVAVTSASPLCPRGIQFWDTSQQTCSNCTSCASGEIVLRPCQPHIDTYCGPLSALRIDWPWVRKQVTTVSSVTPSPRVTHKPRPKKVIVTSTTSTSTVTPEVTSTVTQSSTTTPSTTVKEEEEEEIVVTFTSEIIPSTNHPTTSQVVPLKPVVSAQPFSASEALMWDWQALTMIVAITSCAIFMVVLATYAVIQARSATGRRRQLQKELEEAAADLSLFTTGSGENSADGLLPQEHQSTLTDASGGLYTANQCLYLEKLLERKQRQNQRGIRGNIYVETGRQATPSPARRSTRWKTKPSSLR